MKGLKNVEMTSIRGFSGGNPKSRSDDDREMLSESIDNHGYVIPMVVRELPDGTFELIDGHGRFEQLSARDPNGRVKVLVLDVASVAEGRRILLALQHTAGWDLSKLDKFVVDGLAEGTAMADLMADTGMTGKQLGAFAAAGQRALDELTGGASSGGTGGSDKEPVNLPDRRVSLMFTSQQWDELKDELNGKPTPEEVIRLVRLGKRSGVTPSSEAKSTLAGVSRRTAKKS